MHHMWSCISTKLEFNLLGQKAAYNFLLSWPFLQIFIHGYGYISEFEQHESASVYVIKGLGVV